MYCLYLCRTCSKNFMFLYYCSSINVTFSRPLRVLFIQYCDCKNWLIHASLQYIHPACSSKKEGFPISFWNPSPRISMPLIPRLWCIFICTSIHVRLLRLVKVTVLPKIMAADRAHLNHSTKSKTTIYSPLSLSELLSGVFLLKGSTLMP